MNIAPFEQTLSDSNFILNRKKLSTLQINIGKLCNLACHHCHVEAGPLRTEVMNEETANRLIELVKISSDIKTIDLTGGAPELNPNFKNIVRASRAVGKEVIVRCNITVLFEKGQEETAQFFRDQQVKVVASLPCYSKENVEKQRGRGVFDKSIEGLKLLNNLGYGQLNTNLILDLVYNPVGAFLPPNQIELEIAYKRELKDLFNIDFNNLFTITNMPIKRFLDDLIRQDKLQSYMELLVNHYNPKAAAGVMCRSLISISHDGKLYDCDFNQMLELDMGNKKRSIWDIDNFDTFSEGEIIKTGKHCYACTAGAGSSCGGSIN
jgi:radical SAM/Cys-rich protein